MDVQTYTSENRPYLPPHPAALAGSKAEISRLGSMGSDTQHQGQGLSNLAWSQSNDASNDFRSDFVTKPTLPMLEAIITTSLGDGDMDEDPTTNSFQDHVADLVGHEAALLVVSGTMGNQAALRAALGAPPHSILADHRAHNIILEGGGASSLCGALMKMVVPANGHHLTLDDVKKHGTTTESIYDCPTRVICLENTLWGTIMPLSDMRAISHWARAQNPPIHMHLDGARLWEAVAAGACTLREVGGCFDSIQLCFTKGLGAPIGSIITGSSAFIKRAKWSRKLLGGSTRASGVIAAPARVAIADVFLSGKLTAAQDKAKRASALWEQLGGKLQYPTETNMVWLDLEASGLSPDEFYLMARKFDLKIGEPIFGRLVFHYQITDNAFTRLCTFFRAVLKNSRSCTTCN
ncbi:l-allo-threonine aldolase [Xylona heveae TC161]|uniref:L-allo-threonine aldolase n=1 Tax=Xylona heveae (strain CBS 132557 / TC161) TaxID=1328760 RepID=A0A165K3B4_XYLHT|nr:l-allo-threonine aldolase [Xylona heveae TC161]KZF26939.1 l-allo-threonine aldolase [Xylona heveae TC161]